MAQTICPRCYQFLSDYVESGLNPNLAIAKEIRPHVLRRITPEFGPWCVRFLERLSYYDVEFAKSSAFRISQRGRTNLEYDFLVQNAIYNYLRANIHWIQKEVKYILAIFLEAGLIKNKRYGTAKHLAESYIGFILPKIIDYLPSLHDDLVRPKGLYTNLTLLPTYSIPTTVIYSENITLHDRDDYMSDILNDGEVPTFTDNSPPEQAVFLDVDTSDLYT